MAQNPGGSNVVPQGAVPLGLKQYQGPALGRYQPVASISDPIGQNGHALPQRGGVGSGHQISPSPTPHGAQPIALAGQNIPRSPQAAPQHQQYHQQQASYQQQHQLAGPSQQQGTQTHVISVKALGADGQEYVAEFDAVFPAGSRLLGVTERLG